MGHEFTGYDSFYDHEGEHLHTIYCSATPEYGKEKSKDKLSHEIERVQKAFPGVLYIKVLDVVTNSTGVSQRFRC